MGRTSHRVALAHSLADDPWLLEQLLETAPVGLALIDRDLRFVRVNTALADLNGIPAADHIGRLVPDLLPGLPPEAVATIARVAAGGEPVLGFEFSGETPASPGVERWWRESYYPVFDRQGRCLGANVVVNEITAERVALARATSLARIMTAVGGETDPARIGAVLLDDALPAAGAHYGTVRLLDAEGRHVVVVAQRGYDDLDPRWLGPVPMDAETPVAVSMRERRPVVVPSLPDEAERYPSLAALDPGRAPRALAVVPIDTGDLTIGTVTLGFRDTRRFDESQLAYVRVLSEAAASAIARATAQQTRAAAERALLGGERRERERADGLARTMAAVAGEADPERIAEVLLREAMPSAGARFGLIRVRDGETSTVVLHESGWGEALPRQMRAMPLDARAPSTDAIRSGEPVIVADLDELRERYPDYVPVYERVGQESCAVFPMRTGAGVIGALLLGFDAPLDLDDADRAYIAAIAQTAAAALERARLGEAEQRSRAFLVGVLDQLPAAIIVVDADLRVTFENAAAKRIMGGTVGPGVLPEVGAPGQAPDGSPLAPDDWPVIRAVRTGETILGIEATVRRLDDGREIALSISAGPVADERGQVIGGVGIAQDVTEAKRAAEARDAFMGVLSHELRTPLTSIYGGSQVIARHASNLPPAIAPVADDVAAESLRLLRLVEDLLVIARVERGTLSGGREPVLLHHVARRLVETEQHQWPGLRIELEIGERPPMILADEGQVEAVIRNLLGNAAKYGNGWAGVCVSADDGHVELVVEDDGPGLLLPPEELFRLFTRGPEASRRASGSGIGLFVSRALVESMGGTITASNGSRGACFRMRFPAAHVE